MFEETPIFTMLRILFMQAVGMQAYFLYNALGNKELYPDWTNVREIDESEPCYRRKLTPSRIS